MTSLLKKNSKLAGRDYSPWGSSKGFYFVGTSCLLTLLVSGVSFLLLLTLHVQLHQSSRRRKLLTERFDVEGLERFLLLHHVLLQRALHCWTRSRSGSRFKSRSRFRSRNCTRFRFRSSRRSRSGVALCNTGSVVRGPGCGGGRGLQGPGLLFADTFQLQLDLLVL